MPPLALAAPAKINLYLHVIGRRPDGYHLLDGLVAFAEWEEWLNLIAGLWVVVSPWVLGFQDATTTMRVHLVIGLAVAVLAAIEIYLVHRGRPGVTA